MSGKGKINKTQVKLIGVEPTITLEGEKEEEQEV